MGFTGFLAGDVVFCNEIRTALASLPFLHIRPDGRAGTQQLIRQGTADTGSLVQGLAQFDNSPGELKGPLGQILLWLFHNAIHLFIVMPNCGMNCAHHFVDANKMVR
jgi:hypothetical protein